MRFTIFCLISNMINCSITLITYCKITFYFKTTFFFYFFLCPFLYFLYNFILFFVVLFNTINLVFISFKCFSLSISSCLCRSSNTSCILVGEVNPFISISTCPSISTFSFSFLRCIANKISFFINNNSIMLILACIYSFFCCFIYSW